MTQQKEIEFLKSILLNVAREYDNEHPSCVELTKKIYKGTVIDLDLEIDARTYRLHLRYEDFMYIFSFTLSNLKQYKEPICFFKHFMYKYLHECVLKFREEHIE